MAAGGLTTALQQANPAAAPNQAAQRGAPTTVTRAAHGSQSETPRNVAPTSPRVVGIERSRFTEPYIGHGRAGMDRKTWGMHPWCKQMRLKNVKAGRQPHYRPRAQA